MHSEADWKVVAQVIWELLVQSLESLRHRPPILREEELGALREGERVLSDFSAGPWVLLRASRAVGEPSSSVLPQRRARPVLLFRIDLGWRLLWQPPLPLLFRL